MKGMTIARLAGAAGVGVETVRYYQRRGLMMAPDRPTAGPSAGVRRYAEADVRRLRFIRSAQSAGFSLDEVGELLHLDGMTDRDRARQLAQGRIAEFDRRIAALLTARAALARLVEACEVGETPQCPILSAFDEASPSAVELAGNG